MFWRLINKCYLCDMTFKDYKHTGGWVKRWRKVHLHLLVVICTVVSTVYLIFYFFFLSFMLDFFYFVVKAAELSFSRNLGYLWRETLVNACLPFTILKTLGLKIWFYTLWMKLGGLYYIEAAYLIAYYNYICIVIEVIWNLLYSTKVTIAPSLSSCRKETNPKTWGM